MITEDYVSFETAKLLKEKGFNEFTYSYYSKDDEESEPKLYMENLCSDNWNGTPDEVNDLWFSAPTLQMAMKWLREVHKINIEVCLGFDADSELGYFYNPVISDLKNMALAIETPEFDETEFTVYEEAAEAAIKYCLENLI